MDIKLSPHEQDELNKRFNAFNLDSQTRDLAIKHFCEYKAKSENAIIPQFSILINCAILSASKSQVVTTIQGKKIRGIGISTTQLTRNMENKNNDKSITFVILGLKINRVASKADEFLVALKDFINTVSLDPEVTTDLKQIIDKFAFSYTFFKKYENIFKQLGLKDILQQDDEDYLDHLKNFGWLIYITAKSEILQDHTDLVEAVFLLTVTLGHLLSHLPSPSLNLFLKRNEHILVEATELNNKEKIYKLLFQLLKLANADLESVAYYEQSLQACLKKLLEEGIIKKEEDAGEDEIYNPPKILFHNFNKLETHYQKSLNPEDLDERFFVHEIHTPGRFTPFGRQGAANKNNGDDLFEKPRCQTFRNLNYEVSEKITFKANLNEIKFASTCVPASPYTRLLPPATPMTRAMEMYNWLNDKVKGYKDEFTLPPRLETILSGCHENVRDSLIPRAVNIVKRVLGYEKKIENNPNTASLHDKKMKDKYKQSVGLYLRILEDLVIQEEKKAANKRWIEALTDESFHKALIAAAIETVFFINNSSDVKFEALLKLCEIQAFEFWKIIVSFVKFDTQLPSPVKKHFHDMELRIVLCLAWKKGSIVHQVIRSFMNQNKEDPSTLKQKIIPPQEPVNPVFLEKNTQAPNKIELSHSHETFFKRVLHITASQVQQLCDLLRLGQDIAEKVWNVLKYILSSETGLLIQRHIDQFLLCSVYGVCKAANKSLKFQEIINKYQDLPSFNKNDFNEIIHQVYINDNQKSDLINFYNTVYVAQIKPFIFSSFTNHHQIEIVSATPLIKKPLINALVLESPLKDSLGPGLSHYGGVSSSSKIRSPLASSFSYTPPMAKIKNLNPNQSTEKANRSETSSKRQIDFDSQENELEEFSLKKQKKPSIILGKIVEEEPNPSFNEKTNYQRRLFDIPLDDMAPEKPSFEDNATVTFGGNFNFMKNAKPSVIDQKLAPYPSLFGMSPKDGIENFDPFVEQKKTQLQIQTSNIGGDLNANKDYEKNGALTPEFAKK